jgi:hypothetical protein
MAATRIKTQDIADDAISTAKLQDDAVTFAKLDAAADGAIVDAGSGEVGVGVDDATIEISGNALRVKDQGITYAKLEAGTTKGDILVWNGSAWAELPAGSNGEVLSADSGEATGLKYVSAPSGTEVWSETPAGTINGTNDAFTLANTPTTGTLRLFKNGIRQRAGSGNDYTLAADTITFEAGNVPQTGDILLADYKH